MKLITWNVNGIRAVHNKGFLEFVSQYDPEILCLQETKANPDQLSPSIRNIEGYTSCWASAQKKGYSGVATYTKIPSLGSEIGLGISEYDQEGRVVLTKYPEFSLYNIYFPNGASKVERHLYKQKFLADLNKILKPKIENGEKIIVVGDYNVAHREIDIYDPKKLANESGFLPEERQWFDNFLKIGFTDCFRYLHPDKKDKYTWWSYVERARPFNRGWRIDYICISNNLLSQLKASEILDSQDGSDHCPVMIELNL